MKDHVIYNLVDQLKNISRESVIDLDAAANNEIGNWAALSNRYSNEL